MVVATDKGEINRIEAYEPNMVECKARIDEQLEHMNPVIAAIVREVYNGYGEAIFTYPASSGRNKMQSHHAYLGGLLDHTIEVTEIAKGMMDGLCADSLVEMNFKLGSKPNIYGDMVIAGALLHDVGKIESYRNNFLKSGKIGAAPFKRTEESKILDHIGDGLLMVNDAAHAVLSPDQLFGDVKVCEDGTTFSYEVHIVNDQPSSSDIETGILIFNVNDLEVLNHIIASHHGEVRRGWGSLVDPYSTEAWIVHLADMASSRCFPFRNKATIQEMIRV